MTKEFVLDNNGSSELMKEYTHNYEELFKNPRKVLSTVNEEKERG